MTSADYSVEVASLRSGKPYQFALVPEAEARAKLATDVSAQAIRKLRFEGQIRAAGARDWVLEAKLGATLVQSCIVTLDPVTTRIDTDVTRRYVPQADLTPPEEGAEQEIPEDDSLEVLGATIDLWALIAEELALALPDYPRKAGVDLGEAVFAEPGKAPLTDEDTKPFASLASLRDKIAGQGGSES